jgi:hypothetical protein
VSSLFCQHYLIRLESRVQTSGAWQPYVENSVQETKWDAVYLAPQRVRRGIMLYAHVMNKSYCAIQMATMMAQARRGSRSCISERILPATERE